MSTTASSSDPCDRLAAVPLPAMLVPLPSAPATACSACASDWSTWKALESALCAGRDGRPNAAGCLGGAAPTPSSLELDGDAIRPAALTARLPVEPTAAIGPEDCCVLVNVELWVCENRRVAMPEFREVTVLPEWEGPAGGRLPDSM